MPTVKYPRARELVVSVMRARSIDPDAEGAVPALARMTGLDTRYLYRWFNGEARPNADNTIDLLQRAGLLQLDGTPLRDAPPAPGEGEPSYDELRKELDEVKDMLRSLSDRLDEPAPKRRSSKR